MKEVKHPKLEIKSTVLDKLVSYFDPEAGIRRMHARTVMSVARSGMGGGYTGASQSRRGLAGWLTRLTGGSADADTLPDISTLRERSRDLVRNAPIATGAITGTKLKVVGRGLRVQSKIDYEYLGIPEEQASQWQKDAERIFNQWASKSVSCDAVCKNKFSELQGLAFRSTLESGDCFSVIHRDQSARTAIQTRVRLIEADRVCNENHKTDQVYSDDSSLIAGIQKDAEGRATHIHVMQSHPGGRHYARAGNKWKVLPIYGSQTGRRNVLHLMESLRVDQTRGVPFLAPVIETLKQLDRYTEAEIMAAVVSGLFTVFVKSDTGGIEHPVVSGLSNDVERPGSSNSSSEWNGELGNGLVVDLGTNESIDSANPGRPNTAFDGFVLSIMRQIGVALNIPFEVLMKHFQSSYSASRAALLEAWTFYRERRQWLVDNFCQDIYEAVIEEAVEKGLLNAPGFFQDPYIKAAYLRAVWAGDGPGSIDPLREAQAAEKNMLIHRTTLQDEVSMHDGTDYEDKLAQAGRERKLKVKHGLIRENSEEAASEDTNSDKNERGDTIDD